MEHTVVIICPLIGFCVYVFFPASLFALCWQPFKMLSISLSLSLSIRRIWLFFRFAIHLLCTIPFDCICNFFFNPLHTQSNIDELKSKQSTSFVCPCPRTLASCTYFNNIATHNAKVFCQLKIRVYVYICVARSIVQRARKSQFMLVSVVEL